MYILVIVLSVLLGLSVVFNIELWCLCKELKLEILDVKAQMEGEESGRSNYYFDNATE